MKNETAAVEIEEFAGLVPKMYSYLVHDYSGQEKAKDINKNVVAAIGQYEYKNVLLNKNF